MAHEFIVPKFDKFLKPFLSTYFKYEDKMKVMAD